MQHTAILIEKSTYLHVAVGSSSTACMPGTLGFYVHTACGKPLIKGYFASVAALYPGCRFRKLGLLLGQDLAYSVRVRSTEITAHGSDFRST